MYYCNNKAIEYVSVDQENTVYNLHHGCNLFKFVKSLLNNLLLLHYEVNIYNILIRCMQFPLLLFNTDRII